MTIAYIKFCLAKNTIVVDSSMHMYCIFSDCALLDDK